MNILLVDDEKLLVKGLKSSLAQEGFGVFAAYDGKQALDILNSENVNFIILDIMLPGMDGITLCKTIRSKTDIPILMLTAKDDYVDKILALELGADDYMTKPFNTRELIARIRAITRRLDKKTDEGSFIQLGNLKLNLMERALYIDGGEIPLTSKEFDILKLLVTSPGRVYSREELYRLVWNEDVLDTRTVDVHISNLRDKLEDDPSSPYYIKTKWGVGYYFRKERI